MGYAIKKSSTQEFFVGFGAKPEYTPVWGSRQEAQVWAEKNAASCQAILLHRFGHGAQQKPVAV